MLLAVEPKLRGVVLAAPAGGGKSSLLGGYAALVDEPVVEIPVGADVDGLLGGLDIGATLASGHRVLRQGLLARADGGAIAADSLHLLPEATTRLLAAALDERAVRVEREGVSAVLPARWVLLGCYDPTDGPPAPALLQRIGLLVVLPSRASADQRAEVARRNLQAATGAWDADIAMLRTQLRVARGVLPSVHIWPEQIEQLAALALSLGVEGQRADLFAVDAARAAAALALRQHVDDDDLEVAARLVIMPRATRTPEAPTAPPDLPEPPTENTGHNGQERRATPHRDAPENGDGTSTSQVGGALPAEQVFDALLGELPLDLADLPFAKQRRGRSGSRGGVEGKRGRHIASLPGDPRRARIDVAATLRAAAPWQRVRSDVPLIAQPPLQPRERGSRRQAGGVGMSPESPSSVYGRADGASLPNLKLRASDIRVKRFKSKAGALFLFAVDASGSMALHRMRQAKGAVHALLEQAYINRDRVALLAFRARGAELLLPPSQSVELARRALDLLPTGGSTPVAAALLAALELAAQARSRGIMQTVLVLLTDGRANLAVGKGQITAELQAVAGKVAAAGIRSVVVDTQRAYLSRGEARTLAGWLGGSYVYLPNAESIAGPIAGSIAEAAMELRMKN